MFVLLAVGIFSSFWYETAILNFLQILCDTRYFRFQGQSKIAYVRKKLVRERRTIMFDISKQRSEIKQIR